MLGLKNADHFRKAYLLSAIEAGAVDMTLPDKPKSRLQKYRLTEKGRELQKQVERLTSQTPQPLNILLLAPEPLPARLAEAKGNARPIQSFLTSSRGDLHPLE